VNEILRNTEEGVDADLLTDLCEHASQLYGTEAGRSVCSAVERSRPANARMVSFIEVYSDDPDPEREFARTETPTGFYFGGDLFMAGLNSTRGQAALAAASALFASDEHVERLLPVVERLANDPVMAVRVCAAEAVVALLNHAPDRALVIARELFDCDLDVHDAAFTERLLVFAVLRGPDTFADILAQVIAGPDAVAQHGGRVWAVAYVRDGTPAGVATDVQGLPPAARRGAAEVFANNPTGQINTLVGLFDDDDAEVRRISSGVLRHLADLEPEEVELLIRGFLASASFDEHFDGLIHELSQARTTLPAGTIDVCERAVAAAGGDMNDIRTARAAVGRDLITIILRLYRQGHDALRSRCLDLIDRLTELNALGVSEALEGER
jgi:hypothetical protein